MKRKITAEEDCHRFYCCFCGYRFEADGNDYRLVPTADSSGVYAVSDCPNCGREVYKEALNS